MIPKFSESDMSIFPREREWSHKGRRHGVLSLGILSAERRTCYNLFMYSCDWKSVNSQKTQEVHYDTEH